MVFAYSLIELRALATPGYRKEYHIGVRGTHDGRLFGFITATPQLVNVRGKLVKMVDVEVWSLFSLGELPLRVSEDPQQATGARSDQGGDPSREPQRWVAGHLHRRRVDPHPHHRGELLSPCAEREEADRHRLREHSSSHHAGRLHPIPARARGRRSTLLPPSNSPFRGFDR